MDEKQVPADNGYPHRIDPGNTGRDVITHGQFPKSNRRRAVHILLREAVPVPYTLIEGLGRQQSGECAAGRDIGSLEIHTAGITRSPAGLAIAILIQHRLRYTMSPPCHTLSVIPTNS